MGKRFYGFAWTLMRPLYAILYPHRVYGRENLPAEGGYILCANHMSARDPLYLATQLPRKRQVHFLSKKELSGNRLMAGVMRALGCIPVDRGNADLSAMRSAMQVVRGGGILGIFPQGTRSRDNTPTPFLTGTSMIALYCGAPVVPCYISGPYRLFHRTDVHIGAPVNLSAFGRKCDSAALSGATRLIEDGVWSLRQEEKK